MGSNLLILGPELISQTLQFSINTFYLAEGKTNKQTNKPTNQPQNQTPIIISFWSSLLTCLSSSNLLISDWNGVIKKQTWQKSGANTGFIKSAGLLQGQLPSIVAFYGCQHFGSVLWPLTVVFFFFLVGLSLESHGLQCKSPRVNIPDHRHFICWFFRFLFLSFPLHCLP